MSSLKPFRSCLAALTLTLSLPGCLHPLYGPNASGVPVGQSLAAIEVAPLAVSYGQERLGHYLRSELVFDLDGSGQPREKRYKLTISTVERVQSSIVNTVSGRAEAATLMAEAAYTLLGADGKTVASGKAYTSVSYERNIQRFATIRAARDAEIRAAKLLSEQIKIRLAAALVAEP